MPIENNGVNFFLLFHLLLIIFHRRRLLYLVFWFFVLIKKNWIIPLTADTPYNCNESRNQNYFEYIIACGLMKLYIKNYLFSSKYFIFLCNKREKVCFKTLKKGEKILNFNIN